MATPDTMRMLFQAITSNSNGSQPSKPQIKYSELTSSSMMPIRITAVLKGALAGLIFIYIPDPISLKKGQLQMLHLKPAIVAHVASGVLGEAFAGLSVR